MKQRGEKTESPHNKTLRSVIEMETLKQDGKCKTKSQNLSGSQNPNKKEK